MSLLFLHNFSIVHIIEIIVILLIIGWQIYISVRLWRQINEFKNTFKNTFSISYESNIPQLKSESDNEIFRRIKDAVNAYLLNNFGAVVNFNIVRDIIDRETDVVDEEITQFIPTPLYLGLAGTMSGIILGLFSIPKFTGDNFLTGINVFIRAIQIAILASLLGLFLTTLLSSWHYKRAKSIVQKDKSLFLSYLEANLLPTLVKGDSIISGLKAVVDEFSLNATQLLTKQQELIESSVKKNYENLESLISKIDSATEKMTDNIKILFSTIEKIEKTGIVDITVDMFNRFESNLEAFDNFGKYLTLLEKISSNLYAFSQRTEDIEEVIKNIDISLSLSAELMRFLSEHLHKLDNLGELTKKTVENTDKQFAGAIQAFHNNVKYIIEEFGKHAGAHQRNISEMYEKLDKALSDMYNKHIGYMDKHQNSLEEVYQDIIRSINYIVEFHHDNVKNIIEELKKHADAHQRNISEMYEKLDKALSDMYNKHIGYADKHQNSLEEVYQNIIKSINDIVEAHINNLYEATEIYITKYNEAFNNTLPRFDQLQHLSLLPEIKEQSLSQTLEHQRYNAKQIDELKTIIEENKRELANIREQLNELISYNAGKHNGQLLEILSNISDKLDKKSRNESKISKKAEKNSRLNFFQRFLKNRR